MRVLFLIHGIQARGQEIFACQLADHLEKLGHTLKVISLYPGEFQLPFPVEHFGLTSAKSVWSPGFWKKFQQLVIEFQPDIIQANGGDTLKFAALARIVYPYRGKLIFNNGGVVGHYFSNSVQRAFYKLLLKKIDAAISISDHAAQDLARLLSTNLPQTKIPVGIPMKRELKTAETVPYPVIVHIGGFTPEKNHEFLIGAFYEYHKIHPEAQLWLIGDGPLRREMEVTAKKNLLNSIRFFGSIPDPWSSIPSNSILLLPSKIEGMPAVIAEAFINKIPVVATRVGGIEEMGNRIASCVLIEPGSQAQLLAGMDYFRTLPPLDMEVMLMDSKVKALKRFSMDKVASSFLEFYKKK
ncbi:Glycosyltransferase involved in cell wall bisynthesis [Algoriphagus alkaliphilus]|uniref:Glycosyltransferase involved in cell wall bisynthesis n=1 Tax=Algoriphagus alkaliphilus TaxID=279824 RepID=A0A1G5ZND4_9BACT|nr:glycosyltransferase [Algoriphagus alkaliphilus]SDA96311.1 Glycosyltransferase involved in cell wall bisynthesis [Algoriphagus alkaliphilus]